MLYLKININGFYKILCIENIKHFLNNKKIILTPGMGILNNVYFYTII